MKCVAKERNDNNEKISCKRIKSNEQGKMKKKKCRMHDGQSRTTSSAKYMKLRLIS